MAPAYASFSTNRSETVAGNAQMANATAFPDKDMVVLKLTGFTEQDKSFIQLLMENPKQDQSLLDGLYAFLDQASNGRFLNSLKLEKIGFWIGNTAPARLQVRLMEAAKSSQHAAYAAYREGLVKSGGLERAFPKA